MYKIKQENDNLQNQVKYYKENYKLKNLEGNESKDLYNKNKNLVFFSEMLIQERASLLKQIQMYNSINKECFERIKELKNTCDKQYHSLNSLKNSPEDFKNIRYLLGVTDGMYEETIASLYYCFDMVQNRFSEYNYHLYDLICHYSDFCTDIFTKSFGINPKMIEHKYEKTIKSLELIIFNYEKELQELTRKYNNMNQTMICFIKQENQLIDDIKNINSDSRNKDITIQELKEYKSNLSKDLDSTKLVLDEYQNKNDVLVKKFMIYYKDNDVIARYNRNDVKNTSFIVKLSNKLSELENYKYRINKEIEDLKNQNHQNQSRIHQYFELMREKEIRYNILEEKYNKLFVTNNELLTLNRYNLTEAYLQNFKTGKHEGYSVIIQDLKKEYESQISTLIEKLNQISVRYTSLIDIDLYSRYRKLYFEKNEISTKLIRLEHDLKTTINEKEVISKELEEMTIQYTTLVELKQDLTLNFELEGVQSKDLTQFLLLEKNRNIRLNKEYEYLLSEYFYLQDQCYDKWTWITDLNNDYTEIYREYMKYKELHSIRDIDIILKHGEADDNFKTMEELATYENEMKAKYANLYNELNLLSKENKNLKDNLTECKRRENSLNQKLNQMDSDIKASSSICRSLEKSLEEKQQKLSESSLLIEQLSVHQNSNSDLDYTVKVNPLKAKGNRNSTKYTSYALYADNYTPTPELNPQELLDYADVNPANTLSSRIMRPNVGNNRCNKNRDSDETYQNKKQLEKLPSLHLKRSVTPFHIKGNTEAYKYTIGSTYGLKKDKTSVAINDHTMIDDLYKSSKQRLYK